jgi:heme/copper-type cytochrome/quinol oxidase subunit 1
MKTGTFWCWLWGHKFLMEGSEYLGREGMYNRFYETKEVTKFCVRCGIDKLIEKPI